MSKIADGFFIVERGTMKDKDIKITNEDYEAQKLGTNDFYSTEYDDVDEEMNDYAIAQMLKD